MMNNSVPVISDTTREEQDFKSSNTLRGHVQYSTCSGTCMKSFYDILAPSILTLCFGFPVLLVGIMGLVYFTISFMEQFAVIISIMVLIIIVSTIMIATGVSHLMLLKYETASTSSTRRFMMKYTPGFIVFLLAVVVIALGLTAGVLATRQADVTQLCNNTSLIGTEALQEADCVSRLESLFQNLLGAIAVISITVGILQIFGEIFWCVCLRYEFESHKMNGFLPFLTPVFLIGFTFPAIGTWALLQLSKLHNVLVLQPMIVISVLLIILGVLTGFTLIGFLLGANFIKNTERLAPICLSMALLRICLGILALTGIILGIVAALQSNDVLNNNTFSDYFNDHQVQDAWTATQKYFKCCGVNNFTDYQLVFGNMSVPISCCNTTNPAGTCPEIISNAQQANKAGLIFSRGCASQLESFYHYIFTVAGGVAITVGGLQMIGLITRCIVLQFHSVKATDSTGVVCGRCKLTLASCICMT